MGKTCAFRLPQEMQINGNVVNFRADYPVGYPKKLSTINIDGNSVILGSPHPKAITVHALEGLCRKSHVRSIQFKD